MAQFTGPNLNQPNEAGNESVGALPGAPRLAALGQAINEERQERAEAKALEEQNNIFADVLEEQTELAEAFVTGGEVLTPAEQASLGVFEDGDDLDRQEAMKNPAVRSAVDKLQRIEQARSQAKTPEQLERYYLQAANLNKRMINDYPQYAEVIIAASKKALGFDPIEKAVGLENSLAMKQRDLELDQRRTLIEKAVAVGAVDVGPDGTFDETDAMRKGQALAQQEYMLNQLKTKADLAVANRVPEAEYQRGLFSGYTKSVGPSVEADISQWGANILQLYPTLANDPQSQAKIQEAWNVKRATFMANQERYIAEIPDPAVQAQARTYLKARLEPYDQMFTGDFSTLQVRNRMMQQLNKDAQMDLQTSAPTVARLSALGGDGVTAAIISGVLQGGNLQGQVAQEISQYAGGKPTGAQQELQDFASFLEGEVPLSGMSDKQARQTIKTSTGVINKLATRPNDVTDQELDVYSKMAVQIAAVGVNKNLSPDQLIAATDSLSTPSKMRLFERYANDPNSDPVRVKGMAEGIGALNLKNINTQAGLIREQAVANIPASRDLRTGPETATATPVYNPATGSIEIQMSRTTDNRGQPIPVPRELVKRVNSINQSLEAAYIAAGYEGGQLSTFNELQAKQFIADTAGLETVGARVALPKPKLEEPTETARIPRSNQEMVDAIIEAGRTGDRRAIEAILAGGQGARNPSQPLTGNLNEQIAAVASETGIDAGLFSRLVQTESAGNPSAVSPVGAIGLTQLMPGTAKELGVDPNNPEENLRGGARYLRQQIDRFGDVRKALAAYNWGPSRVAKAVEKYGDEWDQHLPEETENYLIKILGE